MIRAASRGRPGPAAHGTVSGRGALLANADFRLLWVSQALSVTAGNAAMLALPLFMLARTRSPVLAGLVDAVWLAISAAAALPCGAIADRVSKRGALVTADLARATAMTALAGAILSGWVAAWLILALVAVNAVSDSLFTAAMPAALKQIVPPGLLTNALATNQARTALAGAIGPPLGGLLLGIAPALPFVAGAAGYLSSAAALVAIRAPLPGGNRPPPGKLAELTAGLTRILRDGFQRDLLLIATGVNLAFGGIYTLVTVGGARSGVAAPTIGLTVASAAGGSMLGAMLAPRLSARLSARAIFTALLAGSAVLVPAMALTPRSVLLLAVMFACCVILIPAISIIAARARLARTPDEILGRAANGATLIATSGAPLGPLLAGVFIQWSGRQAGFFIFGTVLGVLAVCASSSRALRADNAAHKAALRPGSAGAATGP